MAWCFVVVASCKVTADHGPAVSGAHNTIVTARAGKDLVSALCSGLLTIGPRFGGALDKAAEMFTQVRFGLMLAYIPTVDACRVQAHSQKLELGHLHKVICKAAALADRLYGGEWLLTPFCSFLCKCRAPTKVPMLQST